MDKYSKCAITIYTFQLDVLMTRMGRREVHVSNKLAFSFKTIWVSRHGTCLPITKEKTPSSRVFLNAFNMLDR